MSAPEQVVEAVAKAIHEAQDTGYEWDSYRSSWWDHAREEARTIADAAFTASLEWVADWLPAHTEGSKREGTARWPERDRDIYSAAIEDGQAWLRLLATETEATK